MNISNLATIIFPTNKPAETQKVSESKKEFKLPESNQDTITKANARQLNMVYNEVARATTHVMTNIQQNIFLRDILGLPKEWSALLNEFILNSDNTQIANMLKNLNNANSNTVRDSILALINSNARVDLKAIAELLNKNSALVADKLLKYMGAANMAQNNIAQLKNIMTIGASIASTAQTNPNDFIRDIIQMYLPYLPLVPPKDSDLSEIEGAFSGVKHENTNIAFYLATHFLGYFKIEIMLDETNEIYITNITKHKMADMKEDLCNNLIEDIKKTSIKAKLFFSQKTDEENINLQDKQIFIINSTDSIIGLTLIQLLSKTIFKFDETQGQRYCKSN